MPRKSNLDTHRKVIRDRACNIKAYEAVVQVLIHLFLVHLCIKKQNPLIMKRSAYYLLLFCWCIIPLTAWAADDVPTFTDEEYRARLAALSTSSMEFQFNDLVKERILVRTQKYRSSTERLLGLGQQYFPIFEHYLAKYDVPHFLKYLPIIESRMNPHARSYAAAVGIWQFIKSTGKMYGLRMNKYVDERSNVHRSSEAAARLLSALFKRYKDWALVLAAYNCGPLRVNRAIKAAGEANYWAIQKYLPTETRKYVPYFIAVVYVGEYYKTHNLVPEEQAMDLRFTDTLHFHHSTSFSQLAKEVGLSEDTVALLNPGFLKNYIPASSEGYVVMLPERIIAKKRGYPAILDSYSPIAFMGRNKVRRVHRVHRGENMKDLVKQLRCTERDLRYWNNWDEHYQPRPGDLVAVRSNAAPPPPPPITHLQKVDVIVMHTKGIEKDGSGVQVDRFVEDLSPVPSLESSVPKLAFMPKAQQATNQNKPVRTRYLRRSAQPDAAPFEEVTQEAVVAQVLPEEKELEMPKIVEVPKPSADDIKRTLQQQAVAAKEERVVSTVPLRGQVEALTHLPSRDRGRPLRRAARQQTNTASAAPQAEPSVAKPRNAEPAKAAPKAAVAEKEVAKPVEKAETATTKIVEHKVAEQVDTESVKTTEAAPSAATLPSRDRARPLRGRAVSKETKTATPAEKSAVPTTAPAQPDNFRELIEERSEQSQPQTSGTTSGTGHLMRPKVMVRAATPGEESERDYLGQMVERSRSSAPVAAVVEKPVAEPRTERPKIEKAVREPLAKAPAAKVEKASSSASKAVFTAPVEGSIAQNLDAAVEDDEFSYYQVGQGETLDEVAHVFPNLTVRDLMELNNISSPHEIRPGMLIKIRIQ